MSYGRHSVCILSSQRAPNEHTPLTLHVSTLAQLGSMAGQHYFLNCLSAGARYHDCELWPYTELIYIIYFLSLHSAHYAFDRSLVTGPVRSVVDVPYLFKKISRGWLPQAGWLDIIGGVCCFGVVNLLYSTCTIHVPNFARGPYCPSHASTRGFRFDRSCIHGLFDNRSLKTPGEQGAVSHCPCG